MNKVQPGQPLRIPAETFNAFLDAAPDFRNRQRSVSSESLPAVRQTGIVKVKNASGDDRAPGGTRLASFWECG